jgi:hypothetical protein
VGIDEIHNDFCLFFDTMIPDYDWRFVSVKKPLLNSFPCLSFIHSWKENMSQVKDEIVVIDEKG